MTSDADAQAKLKNIYRGWRSGSGGGSPGARRGAAGTAAVGRHNVEMQLQRWPSGRRTPGGRMAGRPWSVQGDRLFVPPLVCSYVMHVSLAYTLCMFLYQTVYGMLDTSCGAAVH